MGKFLSIQKDNSKDFLPLCGIKYEEGSDRAELKGIEESRECSGEDAGLSNDLGSKL